MRYPFNSKALIDVTKPPYCADNTGKEDCTEILRKILNDILIREVEGLNAIHEKMMLRSDNGKEDCYIGLEAGKLHNGRLDIVFPEFMPATRIIYFPKGEYLVSDTVTYTLDNLKNYYYYIPYYENCRNIHFLGESKEETVIRLVDNSKGFEDGKQKPVISFINNEKPVSRNQEIANAAFMNYFEDITVDCGKGNAGAIGIKYLSSNIGRIDNVEIRAEDGYCGIYFVYGSQGTFSNIKISGFDYGIDTAHSLVSIFENIDVSENKIAGFYTYSSVLNCRNINSGNIDTFKFKEGNGRYYFIDDNITFTGDTCGNRVFFEKEHSTLRADGIPKSVRSENIEDYAFVDDFGAVGDGITDSTRAIRKAMNCGKPIIVFGEGQYLINEKIKIPKSVKTIDFMFCSLASGIRLIAGEYDCVFEISEDSEDLLFLENLFTFEQFRGHFHLVKHNANRDVVFSDIQLMTACLYFNTVSGSKVYLDNCFTTCGTYPLHKWISSEEIDAVYSRIIPYEFHGQTVYGRQINPERAEIAMLNDGSDILLDGFRIEGPGTALKSINNGRSEINIFNSALGYKTAKFPNFDLQNSHLNLTAAQMVGFDEGSEYSHLISDTNNGVTKKIEWDDADSISAHGKIIDYYNSKL